MIPANATDNSFAIDKLQDVIIDVNCLKVGSTYENSHGMILAGKERNFEKIKLDRQTIVCRICLDEIELAKLDEYNKNHSSNRLICPCCCKGSAAFSHQSCIKNWIISNYSLKLDEACCEICKEEYCIERVKGMLSSAQKKSIIKSIIIFSTVLVLLNATLYLLFNYASSNQCLQSNSHFILIGVDAFMTIIFCVYMRSEIKLIFYGVDLDFNVVSNRKCLNNTTVYKSSSK